MKSQWLEVLPGDEAEGQVQKMERCEGTGLQGRRGVFWLQARWQWGL